MTLSVFGASPLGEEWVNISKWSSFPLCRYLYVGRTRSTLKAETVFGRWELFLKSYKQEWISQFLLALLVSDLALPSTGMRQSCPRVLSSHSLGPTLFTPISGHCMLSCQKAALSSSLFSRDRNEEVSACSVSHDYKCTGQPDRIAPGVFLTQGE